MFHSPLKYFPDASQMKNVHLKHPFSFRHRVVWTKSNPKKIWSGTPKGDCLQIVSRTLFKSTQKNALSLSINYITIGTDNQLVTIGYVKILHNPLII